MFFIVDYFSLFLVWNVISLVNLERLYSTARPAKIQSWFVIYRQVFLAFIASKSLKPSFSSEIVLTTKESLNNEF